MSRYNSYIGYFKKTYGERLQKVVVDAGFTCPNRDGLAGRGGCTYCDNAAFHPGYSTAGMPIHEQIDEGIKSSLTSSLTPTPMLRWTDCAPSTRKRCRIRLWPASS